MTRRRCFVPICLNNSINSPNKIFITVPSTVEIRKKWLSAVGYVKPHEDYCPTTGFYCCEDHFDLKNDAENWIFFKTLGGKIRLKKNVLPTLNLEKDINYSQLTDAEKKRKQENITKIEVGKKRRKLLKDQDISTASTSIVSSISTELQVNDKCIQPNVPIASQKVGITTKQNEYYSSSTASSSTCNALQSEELETGEKYRFNFKQALFNIEKNPHLYLGIPEKEFYIITIISNMGKMPYRNVLITLKKLRTNEQYARLAINFGISLTSVSRIFCSSIEKISKLLDQLIYWPNERTIMRRLPMPFRARYSKIQSIINCFEIEIQVSNNATHQALTWSSYKKCNTLKYLISSTPNGFINFVSSGFGGRATDKDIVEESGYLDILPENCMVMADRGFKNIEVLLNKKNCNLVRPPSVSEGEKCTTAAMESKRIASLRIHIECVIRRLREFNILVPHACVNNKLIKWLDCIVIVGCGLTNLQGLLIN